MFKRARLSRQWGVVAFTIAEQNLIGFCGNFFKDFRSIKELDCVNGKGLGQYDTRGTFTSIHITGGCYPTDAQ